MQDNQPATYQLAGAGTRLVAYILDMLVLIFALFCFLSMAVVILAAGEDPTTSASFDAFLLLVIFIARFGYYWYFWMQHDGQTPGKMAMDIRIIRTDGEPLTTGDVFLRAIGYIVSEIPLWLGYIWAFFDDHNQAWHDKIADTYVVMAKGEKKTVTIQTG